MSEKKPLHRFQVGDRVVYHKTEGKGCEDLDGWEGVIVGVYNTQPYYTVRFDNAHPDAVTDKKFWQPGDAEGHDWWCREEHLTLICHHAQPVKASATDGYKKRHGKALTIKSTTYEKKEVSNMENMDNAGMQRSGGRTSAKVWTKEENELIRSMLMEGHGKADICDRLGVSESVYKNHVQKLRKYDATFPREQRGKRNRRAEDVENVPATSAHLGELEQVLSERVTELTHENEVLTRDNEVLTRDNDKLCLILSDMENDVAHLKANLEQMEETVSAQLDRICALIAEKKRLERAVLKMVDVYVVGSACGDLNEGKYE